MFTISVENVIVFDLTTWNSLRLTNMANVIKNVDRVI